MSSKKPLLLLSLCLLFCFACAYIVVPADLLATPTTQAVMGWAGTVTGFEVAESNGTRIFITLRNDTNDWSEMSAVADKPAVLVTSDGVKTACPVVEIGTGRHRLAPGFQMRGYTGGTKKEPITQLLFVECPVAEITSGSTLTFDYEYVVGPYDLHIPSIIVSDEMVFNLDLVTSDLVYPVVDPTKVVVNKIGDPIKAINNFSIILTDVQRTADGLELFWTAQNPSDYPNRVHIGIPPVIGSDGILYGYYEDPSIAESTIALPKDEGNWTTLVKVPNDVTGLFVMPSVETRQSKYFISHLIDITDK